MAHTACKTVSQCHLILGAGLYLWPSLLCRLYRRPKHTLSTASSIANLTISTSDKSDIPFSLTKKDGKSQ